MVLTMFMMNSKGKKSELESISLSPNTKGILVYAKSKIYLNRNWLVLISHVENRDKNLYIRRHASFRIDGEHFYFDSSSLSPEGWGFATGYDFFKTTEEQRQLMVDKLKENNIKFISTLNKLVKAL